MKLKNFLEDMLYIPGSVKIPMGQNIMAYRERYASLKKKQKFHHTVYQVTPGNRHFVWVKVPSETISEPFYYDVVLELAGDSAITFSDCDVTFFSNCPSFVYNGLAYVLSHWNPDAKAKPRMMSDALKGRPKKNSLIIDELLPKLGREASTEKPVVRNPLGIPMLDKSLYYAIFWMQENLTWQQVKATHANVHISKVVASVVDFEHLMVERKRAENRDKDRKESSRKEAQRVIAAHERGIQTPAGILHPKSPMHAKPITVIQRSVKSPKSPKSTRRS